MKLWRAGPALKPSIRAQVRGQIWCCSAAHRPGIALHLCCEQGVQLALGASDIAWLRDLLLHDVLANHGGTFVDLTRTKESLGVISRQLGDASYQRALSAGKPALSLYWLWDCLQLASPQPPIADKLYTPLPSGGIIGAADCKVTVSGIQGALRMVVLDLLHSTGVHVQKDMHLPTITHIIAKQVDDNSQKLVQARRPEFCDHISIVNIVWLLDSIRQRQMQPAEPYLCNVPQENDPCCGARAASARLPGVLVGEDEHPQVPDSPEQAEPQQAHASLAGAAQAGRGIAGPAPAAQPPSSGASGLPSWISLPPGPTPSDPTPRQPYRTPASPRLIPTQQQLHQISGPSRPQPVATAAPTILPPHPEEDEVEDPDADSDGTEATEAESDAEIDAERDASLPHPSADLPAPPIPSASSTHASTQDSQQGSGTAGSTPHSSSAAQTAGPRLGSGSYIPLEAAPKPSPPTRPQTIGVRRARSTGAAAGRDPASADDPPAKRSRRSAPGIHIGLTHAAPVSAQQAEPADPSDADHTAQPPEHVSPAKGAAKARQARASNRRSSAAAQPKQAPKRSSRGPGAADQQKPAEAAAAQLTKPEPQRRRSSRGQASADEDAGCAGAEKAAKPGASRVQGPQEPQQQKQQQGQRGSRRRSGKENAGAAEHEVEAAPSPAKKGPAKQAKAAAPAGKGKGKKAARAANPTTPGPSKVPQRRSKLRTPATAGPRKTPGGRGEGLSRTVVALSKMHTEERTQCLAILRSLQLPVSTAAMLEPSVTHVVAPCLGRNARMLAAMAAGLWIVSWDWLSVSQRSRCLVEPEPFELLKDPTGTIAPSVVRHWRLRAEQTCCGAFHGVQVVLLPDCTEAEQHPTRDELAAMVTAGGGQVVPLAQASQAHAAHLAVVGAKADAQDPSVQQLLQAQVACAPPQILIQWLSQPEEDLSSRLCFGSKLAGHLAAAAQARSRLTLDAGAEAAGQNDA